MSNNDTNDLSRLGPLGYCKPYAFEQITVASTVVPLTAATDEMARFAQITCEGAAVRYRVDGGVPTASVGHILASGASLELNLHSEAANFQAIATGETSAVLSVTYYV